MIKEFRNEYFFLSNFFTIPVSFMGLTYQSNEAAFQAMKCINPKDREQFTHLNPSEAKKLGRKDIGIWFWGNLRKICAVKSEYSETDSGNSDFFKALQESAESIVALDETEA